MPAFPPSPATDNVLVLPMSAIALAKRCLTAFDLGYNKMLNAVVDKQYVTDGTNFHAHMAAYAHERRGTPVPPDLLASINAIPDDNMYEVALAYIRNRAAARFDDMSEIIAADRESEAVYLPIVLPAPARSAVITAYEAAGQIIPEVWVRMTHDLVYRRRSDNFIYAIDYKTFERMPTHDYDLDFQARLYIAGLMQKFKTADVHFEFANVRRAVPMPVTKWKEEECYVDQPMVISVEEARNLWEETQFDVARILLARVWGQKAFSHTDLKGTSPHTCHTCFYKALCKRQYAGTLDADAIAELSTPRAPIVLPPGVRA